jgi:hypothetical protein
VTGLNAVCSFPSGRTPMNLPSVPILSDLDGTLIDSQASVVAAFRWWAHLRGLSLRLLGLA